MVLFITYQIIKTLVWSKKSIGSIARFHLTGVFCQFSERTSFKMIPGSGISSKSPGYVPAKSISCGRRQYTNHPAFEFEFELEFEFKAKKITITLNVIVIY